MEKCKERGKQKVGTTRALGKFISNASFGDLPLDVIRTAKDRILDALGVQLLGYSLKIHRPLFDIMSKGGTGESTIVGEGAKVPCNVSTLINSCMSVLLLTDGSRFGGVHPSASVIPAALAVGERENVEGKDLILSVVLGYEVMIRVACAMQPSCVRRGFHPTSVVSSIGSATAAGKLLRLGEVEMANCLSVAATLSSGLMDAFKAIGYLAEIQVARSAEAGVLASLLASTGLKGYARILEEAFLPAFSDVFSIDLITEGLGSQFRILKSYIKKHWGCAHVLAPIDATMELVEKHGIRAEDVIKISVYTYSLALEGDISEPRTGKDAAFSIPFVISLVLADGSVSPEKFSDEKVKDNQIQKLMKKVEVKLDPEIDKTFPQKRGVKVEILTESGEMYSQKLDFFKGEPEWPLNRQEIERKFINLASRVVGVEQSENIIRFVERLEDMESIQPLFSLLTRRE